MDRGKRSEAKNIISELINNSKDDNVVTEAMYFHVAWKFAKNEIETFEKRKAYYPNYCFST